jgi:hypothetical protein
MPEKKPFLKHWKQFQTRLPTVDEVTSWWTIWPDAGVAIVTGTISGYYVIDIDPRNNPDLGKREVPVGPKAQTLHGGYHHFCKSSSPLRTKRGILPGVDFKGDGGYVVVAPTPGYTWIEEAINAQLPDLPEWVIKAHRHPRRGKRVGHTKTHLSYTGIVRCLDTLNAEGWRRRLHKQMRVWYILHELDQQLGPSGWLSYLEVLPYLFNLGFSSFKQVEDLLRSGEGIFWDFHDKHHNCTLIIRLQGVGKVCELLGVKIRSDYDKEHNVQPHWQILPLEDFLGNKWLSFFRSIACYEPKKLQQVKDKLRGRKIDRASIGDFSFVSKSTQVRDDRELGLDYNPTYTPNLETHGPKTLQEASYHIGVATHSAVGQLGWLTRRNENRHKTFTKPVGGSNEPVQSSPTRSWRWFASKEQFDYASDRAAKGKLPLNISIDAEVPMTPEEVARFGLRPSVSLWHRPRRAIVEDLRGGAGALVTALCESG